MAKVIITLHRFESHKDAERIASGLREAGAISYPSEGGTPTVLFINDITVEENE